MTGVQTCALPIFSHTTLRVQKPQTRQSKNKASITALDYAFTELFSADTTQAQVCQKVGEPLVSQVFAGHKASLLAYGQTGTGKTFSMWGPVGGGKTYHGIIPYVLQRIFQKKTEQPTHSIEIAYLQIYQEQLQDLFIVPEAKVAPVPLFIRERADNEVFVENLSWQPAEQLSEVQEWITIGNKNRKIAATQLNQKSSRGHALFFIRVTSAEQCTGTLLLADLAGSEAINKAHGTQTLTSTQRRESVTINKSLTQLGLVMQALHDKAPHIPFRNSM